MSTTSASAIARWVGLALDDGGRARRVVLRRDMARALEPVGQPADAVGVLRVDHHQRAFVSGQREHVEDLDGRSA